MPSIAVRPMADVFAVLKSRSIFARGRSGSYAGANGSAGASAAATSRPTRPEDSLIFNGVTDADGSIVAFIEDTAAGRINRIHVGDSIARGRVTRITLDTLEYEANGQATNIQIGQNLSGTDMTGGSTAGYTGGSGDAARPGAAPSAGGGNPNDVLERMKRARQEGK